jgi:hypothetical protein
VQVRCVLAGWNEPFSFRTVYQCTIYSLHFVDLNISGSFRTAVHSHFKLPTLTVNFMHSLKLRSLSSTVYYPVR